MTQFQFIIQTRASLFLIRVITDLQGGGVKISVFPLTLLVVVITVLTLPRSL